MSLPMEPLLPLKQSPLHRQDCHMQRGGAEDSWPVAGYEAFSSSGAPGSPAGGQTAAVDSAYRVEGMQHRISIRSRGLRNGRAASGDS